MLVQLVHIRVLPGKRDAFLEAFRPNWAGARDEPGNVRFDLLCDPEDDHSFTVYEVFADEAALQAHRETAHYRECVARIGALTTGPRRKRFLTAALLDRHG